MKNFKKVLALVLVLATLMGFATVAGAAYKDAADISGDYTEAVKVLELIETMEGYPDGTFGPKKTITREEAAKLIAIFDNKDSDISTYYTSINPFADEKGRWGESYVGYGYRAGIIAGMNATTYAPTANVTGTQFLKMALVTLGYDQEAEGFVGSSWAVNVLALARKLDLIDGLADGWKAEKDLTREEAAQILLNTLKADTVEYAQEAKQVGFKPTATKNDAGTEVSWTWGGRIYLTVAGAVSTGKKLYKDFDLEVSTSYDAFNRPYTKWAKGKDSVEVMKAPKATFTTRFNACDLLAELGVAKTDKKTNIVIDYVWCDGLRDDDCELLKKGNGDDYTLKADAKYKLYDPDYDVTHEATNITKDGSWGIWHHEDSTCKTPSGAKHGAQGTLTQVFYNGKDSKGNKHYIVTSIETWLAKVDSVITKTTSRDEHIRKDGAVKIKEVYFKGNDATTTVAALDETYNFPGYCSTWDGHCDRLKQKAYDADGKCKLTYDDPTGIAKGDYVLLTYSFKTGEEGVQSLDVTEGKDGRLNGSKNDSVAYLTSETRVDGEYIKDSVHFHLGYNISKSKDFGTYTFFYDAYGNVIGMKDAKDTSTWGVFDRMWVTFENKGETIVNADVVGMDAKTNTTTIKKWDGYKKDNYAYDVAKDFGNYPTNGEAYDDFKALYDHLYKYSANSEGKYTWGMSDKVQHAGSLANLGTTIKLTNKTPYMTFSTAGSDGKTSVTLTAETEILVHNMDGTYSSYTGYKNVESMIAHYAEYVMDDDNKYAEVVYLTNDVYTTNSKFVAFVGTPADNYVYEMKDDGDWYYGLEVYVGAEKKVVYLEEQTMTDFFDYNKTAGTPHNFVAGFYEFQYLKVDGEEIVRLVKVPNAVTDKKGLETFTNDKTKYLAVSTDIDFFNGDVIKLAGEAKRFALADDCNVYGIYEDGVITDRIDRDYVNGRWNWADADLEQPNGYIVGGAHNVYVELNSDNEVINLYFILAANDD